MLRSIRRFSLGVHAEGGLIIMPPTDRHTSLRNAKAGFQLTDTAEGPVAGFVLNLRDIWAI